MCRHIGTQFYLSQNTSVHWSRTCTLTMHVYIDRAGVHWACTCTLTMHVYIDRAGVHWACTCTLSMHVYTDHADVYLNSDMKRRCITSTLCMYVMYEYIYSHTHNTFTRTNTYGNTYCMHARTHICIYTLYTYTQLHTTKHTHMNNYTLNVYSHTHKIPTGLALAHQKARRHAFSYTHYLARSITCLSRAF